MPPSELKVAGTIRQTEVQAPRSEVVSRSRWGEGMQSDTSRYMFFHTLIEHVFLSASFLYFAYYL